MDVYKWSETAASNNSAVPDGAPEGWTGANVNNWGRETMAAVRTWYDDSAYVELLWQTAAVGATTVNKVSDTAIRIISKDATAIFTDNRRIRLESSGTFYYGYVNGTPTFSTDTDVTVVMDGGTVPATIDLAKVHADPTLTSTAFADLATLDADTVDTYEAADLMGFGRRNAAINGAFDVWQGSGVSSISCTAATDTWTADMFYVNPAGAAVTVDRVTTGLPSGKEFAYYGHKITGASSATAVLFGTRVEARRIPMLSGTVTISVKIQNETNADLTPTLLINTCDAADVFSAVTNRLSTSSWTSGLVPISDGDGAILYHTVDISGYTNLANGLDIQVSFPSGALDGSGKDLTIAEFQVELSSERTTFQRLQPGETLRECQEFFCKTFDQDVAPAENTTDYNGALYFFTAGGHGAVQGLTWQYPVVMWSTPSVTTYSPNSTGSDFDEDTTITPGGDTEARTIVQIGDRSCVIHSDSSPPNGALAIHAIADARLT